MIERNPRDVSYEMRMVSREGARLVIQCSKASSFLHGTISNEARSPS